MAIENLYIFLFLFKGWCVAQLLKLKRNPLVFFFFFRESGRAIFLKNDFGSLKTESSL